jgi:hypothetical protein
VTSVSVAKKILGRDPHGNGHGYMRMRVHAQLAMIQQAKLWLA